MSNPILTAVVNRCIAEGSPVIEAQPSPNLFPAGHPALCDDGHRCSEAVVSVPLGRWYITFGHCGFNSQANNASGYGSRARAVAAIRAHQRTAFTAKIEAVA